MDNIISVIYAIFGLSYTVLAGRGKFICFFFGISASLLYSLIAFKNALWGSFLLNFFYYVPIEIISLINWIRNTDKSKKTVNKISIKTKEFLVILLSGVIISICVSYVLYLNHDKSPVLDATAMIFSILGAYLTAKRALEQWIIWTIVNLTTCIMWLLLIVQGENGLPTLFLWFTYLILGIIYYFNWKKEIKPTSNQQ